MSAGLLAGLTGLALLDSLNPATIIAVTLILIAAPRRHALLAGASVLGSALTVFIAGAALFLSAGAAADAVDGVVIGLRFVAFGAAGVALIAAGLGRLRDRERKVITLPAWFGLWTALPFGVLLAAADLPNAFPYFIAIERMIAAGVTVGAGLGILAGYAVIYCLPCLVLLAVGLEQGPRMRARLDRLVERLGTGTVNKSLSIALLLVAAGIAVGSAPLWLW